MILGRAFEVRFQDEGRTLADVLAQEKPRGFLRGAVLGSWVVLRIRHFGDQMDPGRSLRNRVLGFGRLRDGCVQGRFLTASHFLVPFGLGWAIAFSRLPLGHLGIAILAIPLLIIAVLDAQSFREDCELLHHYLSEALGSKPARK